MRLLRRITKLAVGLCAFLFLVACALHVTNSTASDVPAKVEGTHRVATHNVHYILMNEAEGAWSRGDWQARAPAMDAAFKAMDADIVAFQEMESFAGGNSDDVNLARSYLLENNPGYAAAAVGDWRDFPSTQPIFYRTDRYELVDQGWFFFSDTPDVIYSRTFNGSYPAFASWARFRELSGGTEFVVKNVHYEYRSGSNRLKSAELTAQRLAPFLNEGLPVLLVGDLNARLGSETAGILEDAGLAFLDVDGATYHFDRGINLFGAIDHIGLSQGITARAGPFTLQRKFAGEWPSDHYPVLADITLPE
ncbi:Endonuclease/Exonuclease/phosphatase family protein [Roseivivax sp. THAF40]|uniref:endonuclease/exonuclease/phosphatase family protein n=1 Tax=unclassified Roseivivax TaxID=2639302 RepID=UPI001269244C|nr:MULTISPECIES: endonuclease/exonuclease/phosphatase family protein [unclassified Roseivivax]QFS81400.1 Endonuclease/Exonuclease/phosphatase family protein [Roseivivax sp. THAF197b]QFT45129.1 Endonuclease/Exonuclease/phosphatase family protein [Roseivivax sp. THAF40]